MSTAAGVRRGAVASGPTATADAASPQARLRRRWRALAPRERSAVRAVLWLLGVLVVWLAALQPAWRTVREAPAQLAQVEAQLQQMRRLADEARGLRGAVPVSTSQAAAALRAATERLGGGARIAIQGERATLTLPAAGGTAAAAGGLGSAARGFGSGDAGGAAAGTGFSAGGGNGAAISGDGNAVGAGGSTSGGGAFSAAGGTAGSGAGGISGDALRGWLAEARSAARARPVDLQLTRAGGHFSGSVVVLIGAGGTGTGSAP